MSVEPQNPQMTELTDQQLSEQEGIRREKLKKLVESGNNPYAVTHFDVTHESVEIFANFDALEGQIVRVAGRMISKRVNERFPNNTESTVKLGWYAFVRASQLRRMRAPKPRVSPGDTI